jgi:hypothetical protein
MRQEAPLLQEWSTRAPDHLCGRVFGHGTYEDGTLITTSRVMRVELVGPKLLPLAHTSSGSVYRLGDPWAPFGRTRAEAFVRQMVLDPQRRFDAGADTIQTGPIGLDEQR